MVARESAVWYVKQTKKGPIRDYSRLAITNRKPKPDISRARTIGAREMERAYVDGNRRERRRIELYGVMSQEELIRLGAVPS